METFATSKRNFKHNLNSINDAYLKGNDFWFDASQYGQNPDQNLHVDFNWGGNRFLLVENVGYTNGGASWSEIKITKYDSGEVVYRDNYHDGNGAWQTGDSSDARCEYSELTNYIIKILSAYVK